MRQAPGDAPRARPWLLDVLITPPLSRVLRRIKIEICRVYYTRLAISCNLWIVLWDTYNTRRHVSIGRIYTFAQRTITPWFSSRWCTSGVTYAFARLRNVWARILCTRARVRSHRRRASTSKLLRLWHQVGTRAHAISIPSFIISARTIDIASRTHPPRSVLLSAPVYPIGWKLWYWREGITSSTQLRGPGSSKII